MPSPDGRNPATPRRKATATDDQVVAAYRRNGSAYPAARQLGVAAGTVYRVLALCGVPTAGSGRGASRAYAPARVRQIAQAYAGSATVADLVAGFGGSRATVERLAPRGVAKVDASGHRDARVVGRIVRLRLAGEGPSAIAEAVGKLVPVVSAVLRRAGVTEGHNRLAVRRPKCGGKG
jgi:hypothetical protein